MFENNKPMARSSLRWQFRMRSVEKGARLSSKVPARKSQSGDRLLPQCVAAQILDLPFKLGRYKLPQSLRTIQEGLGDPVLDSLRARVAEGGLGHFLDCKVCRQLKRPQENLPTDATDPGSRVMTDFQLERQQ